jgi:hypothetical protein
MTHVFVVSIIAGVGVLPGFVMKQATLPCDVILAVLQGGRARSLSTGR